MFRLAGFCSFGEQASTFFKQLRECVWLRTRERTLIMPAILKGVVKYNKVMEGDYQQGARKGEHWEFLSLEIVDTSTGFVWSCQLPSEDASYKNTPDNSLKGHIVKAKIMGQTAGERQLPNGQTRMQIRSSLSKLEDLGEPDDDEL